MGQNSGIANQAVID